ncbi:MAG: hypothetical protein IPG04_42020 [Polyangiaceae bacterium]|nr:hypothetical protein [Polyangiaceae bacterium]
MKVDLAVAETEPFLRAQLPPHPGRFRKPLVIARLASGDVWIDADVQGPPLPPGRVSPGAEGAQRDLERRPDHPRAGPSGRDGRRGEGRSALDAQGTAKGTIS